MCFWLWTAVQYLISIHATLHSNTIEAAWEDVVLLMLCIMLLNKKKMYLLWITFWMQEAIKKVLRISYYFVEEIITVVPEWMEVCQDGWGSQHWNVTIQSQPSALHSRQSNDLSILAIKRNEQRARLTWHNGDGSTYICKFLPGEVFNQAADQGALSHLWGANHNNHYWGRFQRSAVHSGDVMLLGLYVLGSGGGVGGRYTQQLVLFSITSSSSF